MMMAQDTANRLEVARLRERAARAKVARLRRVVDGQNRRVANQRKYVLGAAMLALAESGKAETMVSGFRRWLERYVSRDQDRAALVGTVFDLTAEGSDHAAS
jgi:anthranilate phosphoribosyltransferase